MKIVMLPRHTYKGIFYLLEIEPAYLLQDAKLALEICFISILLFNNTIKVIFGSQNPNPYDSNAYLEQNQMLSIH